MLISLITAVLATLTATPAAQDKRHQDRPLRDYVGWWQLYRPMTVLG